MTKRVAEICSRLGYAPVFADIGCDHGYMTQYMLKNKLCERAYISDISAGSLAKAKKLLRAEIGAGRCIPLLGDGLRALPEPCDLVLIAGLGGEEIVRILGEFPLPARFVLQPMRNSDKVRAHLVERGAAIEHDYTFEDGKFYDLIAGRAEGGDEYSDFELKFGRDNLRCPSEAFLRFLRSEQAKLKNHLSRKEIVGESRDALRARLYETEEITDAVEGDL